MRVSGTCEVWQWLNRGMSKESQEPADKPVDPFKAALEAKKAKAGKGGQAHVDGAGKNVKSGPDVTRRLRQRRMGGS